MSRSDKVEIPDTIIRLFIVCVFAVLYSMGGTDFGKYWRRFVAPTILAGGLFWKTRSWKGFAQGALMMFSLSIGYGADIELWKIVKRGVYGLANGVTSSFSNFFDRKWLMICFQTVLLIAAYIAFGVYNPFPSSRIEELVLGFLIAFLPMMSAQKK